MTGAPDDSFGAPVTRITPHDARKQVAIAHDATAPTLTIRNASRHLDDRASTSLDLATTATGASRDIDEMATTTRDQGHRGSSDVPATAESAFPRENRDRYAYGHEHDEPERNHIGMLARRERHM